jgi:hypothetical protein
MLINLHKQATKTPMRRAAILASNDADTALAERFGGTAQPIYKRRKRESVEDRSHTAGVYPHLHGKDCSQCATVFAPFAPAPF